MPVGLRHLRNVGSPLYSHSSGAAEKRWADEFGRPLTEKRYSHYRPIADRQGSEMLPFDRNAEKRKLPFVMLLLYFRLTVCFAARS
jgi:hypothetical protein